MVFPSEPHTETQDLRTAGRNAPLASGQESSPRQLGRSRRSDIRLQKPDFCRSQDDLNMYQL